MADRIVEYHALGIDEFIMSGYPNLEEAYWFGRGGVPLLAEGGHWRQPRPGCRSDGRRRFGSQPTNRRSLQRPRTPHEDPMTTTASAAPSPYPSLSGPAATHDLVAVAKEVSADLATRAERHDREGSYAPENIDAIWAAGLGNLTLPAELGGAGPTATASKVIETLAMGDASTALIFLMHQFHLRTLSDPRERMARPPAPPDHRGLAGWPGTDQRPPGGTRARHPGPRWRPGHHRPGHQRSRHTGVEALGSQDLQHRQSRSAVDVGVGGHAPEDPEGQRIGFFVVPADTDGIEIVETWDHLGMRASASHDVVFHDVEIPIDDAAASSHWAIRLRPMRLEPGLWPG